MYKILESLKEPLCQLFIFAMISILILTFFIVSTVAILATYKAITTEPPTYEYIAELYAPNGELMETWNITSTAKPRVVGVDGGRTTLRHPHHMLSDNWEWWTKEIYAPTGWLLKVKEKNER